MSGRQNSIQVGSARQRQRREPTNRTWTANTKRLRKWLSEMNSHDDKMYGTCCDRNAEHVNYCRLLSQCNKGCYAFQNKQTTRKSGWKPDVLINHDYQQSLLPHRICVAFQLTHSFDQDSIMFATMLQTCVVINWMRMDANSEMSMMMMMCMSAECLLDGMIKPIGLHACIRCTRSKTDHQSAEWPCGSLGVY